jgi:hypothetical protein
MSNRSRYKLKTKFVNKAAFLRALPIIEREYASQGLKLIRNEKAKTVTVDWAPIQTFQRVNLVFQEQKNEIAAIADPYRCKDDLNRLIGSVERAYKDQIVQEYYALEGFAVQEEKVQEGVRLTMTAY